MCGICGSFGVGNPSTIQRMLDVIHHRGPDDEYFLADEHFSLGARRLSIVDLEGGRQPIWNSDKTVCVAQNGEIYNYPDLHQALTNENYKFSTRCDTEVLVHLYNKYGIDFTHHIDGMFAVAVWDAKNRTGVIARDRVGKKPLYYWINNGVVYFASEIKSLLQVPSFQRKINVESLYYYLALKHVPAPNSIFQDVKILPPGHRLIYREGRESIVEAYHQFDFTPFPDYECPSEEEAIDHFIHLLRKAVKRRLMSDVPIGFFLSGGIDSSLTTYLASEVAPEQIKTFTLTYNTESTTPGKDKDREWATWVSNKIQSNHHEEEIGGFNLLDNLRNVIQCFDEPFAGVISTYFLSRLMSSHVKVTMSGDGADELFRSYLTHRVAAPLAWFAEYKKTNDPSVIQHYPNPDFLNSIYEPEDWRWRAKLCVYRDQELLSLLSDDVISELNGSSVTNLFQGYFSTLRAKDPLNRILEAEFKTILPDQVLAFVDRLSMAHSLEVRAPFLDTELVSFVARLPGWMKINQGETKSLLKKAALRFLPREMLYRPKEGFLMPIAKWILNHCEDYVHESLNSSKIQNAGYFNNAKVQSLIESAYREGSDYRDVNKIYALIVFHEWYDAYMVGDQ